MQLKKHPITNSQIQNGGREPVKYMEMSLGVLYILKKNIEYLKIVVHDREVFLLLG